MEFGLIGCSQVLPTLGCAGNFNLGTLWVAQSLSLVGTTLPLAPPSSSLMWRRAVTARLHIKLEEGGARSDCSPPHQTGGGCLLRPAWWYCAAFTWIQRRFKSKWKNPDRCWSEPRCHCIQFDRPIHTQFYRAWSPYDYCDCKCGRICRGSSRWVPFSTIFRQTQMLDVNWCGCIHERLKFRRWKSC